LYEYWPAAGVHAVDSATPLEFSETPVSGFVGTPVPVSADPVQSIDP
jgi:hypothetical protein